MLGKNRFGVFTDISSQRTVVWPDVHALVSVLRVLVFFFFWIKFDELVESAGDEKQTKQSSLRRSKEDCGRVHMR